MAFSPIDFYNQAVILQRQAQGDDAALRSCMSRAYYGAFLTARDAKNLSSGGSTGHKDVIQHYKNTGNTTDRLISDSLKDLKALREKADYEVRLTCTTKDGQDAMMHASKVFKLMKKGLSAPPNAGTGTP